MKEMTLFTWNGRSTPSVILNMKRFIIWIVPLKTKCFLK